MASFNQKVPDVGTSPYGVGINVSPVNSSPGLGVSPGSSSAGGGVNAAPRYEGEASSFLGSSHPIPQPPADESKKVALEGEAGLNRTRAGLLSAQGDIFKTQGDILRSEGHLEESSGDIFKSFAKIAETGAEAAVTFIKKGINDKVWNDVTNIRDPYTQSLDDAKTVLGASGLPLNILTGKTEELPNALQDIPKSLEVLKDARESGKLPETPYLARLLSGAKSLRSQYPEFRDYIDQQYEKITGVNPANAYIKSVLGDINDFLTKANSQQEKDENTLRQNWKWLGEDYIKYRNGDPNITKEFLFKKIATSEKLENDLKLKNQARQDIEGDVKLSQESAQRDAGAYATGIANQVFNEALDSQGLNPAKVRSIIGDHLSGFKLISGDTAIQHGMYIQSKQSEAEAKIWTRWSQPGEGADKRSMIEKMGSPEKAQAILKNSMTLFEGTSKMIFDEKMGIAHSMKLRSDAIVNGETYSIYTDPSMKGQAVKIAAVSKAMGPEGAKWLDTWMAGNIQKIIGGELHDYLNTTGLDLSQDPKVNQAISLKAAVELAQKNGITSKPFYQRLTELPQELANPKLAPEIKEIWVNNMYDPVANKGVISKFEAPHMEVENGRLVSKPGYYEVYGKLFSPEISKSVKELDEKKPGTWAKYKTQAENSFKEDLVGKELLDLNTIQKDSSVILTYSAKDHRFDLEPAGFQNPLFGRENRRYLNDPRINRINSAINTLSNVYRQDSSPDEVNSQLLQVFTASGLVPAKGSMLESMFKSVLSSVPKKEEKK